LINYKLNLNDKQLLIGLYGCELIYIAGVMLHLTQITISTAQIIFQRFYRRNENRNYFPAFYGSMTSLYLATKLQEEKRRHRDILNIFDRIIKRRQPNPLNKEFCILDPCSKRYQRWKEYLLKLELIILRDLGYYINIILPHDYLLQCIKYLNAPTLAEDAWSYINDSLRIYQLSLTKPKIIACSSIYQSHIKNLEITLPIFWWKSFEVSIIEIIKVCKMFKEIYIFNNKRLFFFDEHKADKRNPIIERINYPAKTILKKKVF